MRAIWGAVTEVHDRGAVAEHCPHCGRITTCLLRSVCRGDYIFFLKTTDPVPESSCLCTACLQAFHSAAWRYAAVVPVGEAKALPLDDLLARTNPVVAERLRFKAQVGDLGGDARFAAAYEHLEGLRPGALRAGLLRELLSWDRLGEEQRAVLGQRIAALARAWHFARQVAPAFPAHTGCLTLAVATLVAALALLGVPALRHWLWGTVTVASGLVAAAFVSHTLQARRVSWWARRVLIPEAQDAAVSLDCFVAVVDDVPGSRHGLTEDVWPLKDQLATIRRVLIAEGEPPGQRLGGPP
jgi:hypothetical protein